MHHTGKEAGLVGAVAAGAVTVAAVSATVAAAVVVSTVAAMVSTMAAEDQGQPLVGSGGDNGPS